MEIRRIGWGGAFCFLCTGLICMALSSCSLFQSNMTPHASYSPTPPAPPAPECKLPYCSVDLDFPLSRITKPKIYVLKADRRLWLVQDSTLVRDYRIALGPSPRGDKYFRGDGRTPEGDFFVCSKNSCSHYYKSLGISYPDPNHAQSALSCGMISFNDYCSIKQATDTMKMPPANTALGGQVMIHGGGCYADWTLGCVALRNSDIDELFSVVPIGTPICIMP